jgi:hypothetical protein
MTGQLERTLPSIWYRDSRIFQFEEQRIFQP